MTNNSLQGLENHLKGQKYQKIVRDYLENKFNLLGRGLCQYQRGKIDVTFPIYSDDELETLSESEVNKLKQAPPEMRIEVKGLNLLSEKTKKSLRCRSFKINTKTLHPDLNWFAFVVIDSRVCLTPLIYFVNYNIIKEYLLQYRLANNKGEWMRISFFWILEIYDPELSKIGV